MYVTVRNLLLGLVGVCSAIWMGAAPSMFGLGGDLLRWYLPLITLPFALLQIWVVRRVTIAERRDRPVKPAVYVALSLSWLCALGFGVTVPESDGERLATLASHFWGEGWLEMSIALCNPFGILAFATVIAALIFAIASGRDPRPSEDELLDALDGHDPTLDERGMVPHPLEHRARASRAP